jgi:hypothetical protein
MPKLIDPVDPRILDSFAALAGGRIWRTRLTEIQRSAESGRRSGQAMRARHAVELTVERLRKRLNRELSAAERQIGLLAAEAVAVAGRLSPAGRERLCALLARALRGEATLVPLFHLLRTAVLQRSRGFDVAYAGLDDGAPFDLLLTRDRTEAEVACDVISAEEGRGVHRGAWFRLADRVDPDLQTWLAAHPGRYLLKMTLPQGLQGGLSDATDEGSPLAVLHGRIRTMLATSQRRDHDEAVVLRLDPLLLAGAQAGDLGLLTSLRREFGPEAHLSVTAAGGGVFVMAARSGQENEIAVAVRKRLATLAPTRLTGTRPGILAMFIEDTDRTEWRSLREQLELEGETRQFLAGADARRVVAVTCASRLEMFGMTGSDVAPEGELRFRNPAHPAAKAAALAPAVLSSV